MTISRYERTPKGENGYETLFPTSDGDDMDWRGEVDDNPTLQSKCSGAKPKTNKHK